MLLLYRNRGERRYGKAPLIPYRRGAWEFQFLFDGHCNLLLRKDESMHTERITVPTLVVSGPDCVHGWGGEPSDVCRSIIFHFDEAEYTVRTIVGNEGYRRIPLRAPFLPLIEQLYDRCGEARKTIGATPIEAQRSMGVLEPLIYRIVASELTLFFLKHIPRVQWGDPPNYGTTKVNEAMAWYEANLQKGPSIAEVAEAIHLSSSHLRRLFHKVRGISPQEAFTDVQFERAKWLMRDPEMTLEQISEHAGFGSGSAFSRAFKAEFQISPLAYRQRIQASPRK